MNTRTFWRIWAAGLAVAGYNALLLCSAAAADDRLTVVELFTSQGCSSCPPADRYLTELSASEAILPLSWAVDYWDRLGWKDTYGHPDHTRRQTLYNQRMGRGGVYTPQVIIDGRRQMVGSDRQLISESVAQSSGLPRPEISIDLSRSGPDVTLQIQSGEPLGQATISLIWYQHDARVQVGKGENRGRRLHYTNVVRAHEIIGAWSGDPITKTLNTTEKVSSGVTGLAVLVQQDSQVGPVLAASKLALIAAPDTAVSR